ncbi:hypothetical protein [Frankia sp. EAN1pec]|uniref:hypothetical protein n=1 Tax=Parafrankia sp. (strain EAN1pec) TaxID=298653 RepID=UPI00059E3C3C
MSPPIRLLLNCSAVTGVTTAATPGSRSRARASSFHWATFLAVKRSANVAFPSTVNTDSIALPPNICW